MGKKNGKRFPFSVTGESRMYVSRLALDHFRSWEHVVVDFTPGVNILQGANGLGKTNIVEAVEVLSTGSSHRASSSLPLVERGCTSAVIRANVENSAAPAGSPAADRNPDGGENSLAGATASTNIIVEKGSISPSDGPLGESGVSTAPNVSRIATGDSGSLTDSSAPQAATAANTATQSSVDISRNSADATQQSPSGHGGAVLETTTYELTVAARGANRARVNGGKSTYLRDVIGRIPSVSFTPEDQRLVAGDPASRRTLLNQAGALLIPGYADRLQTIAKIAKQRAALLKQLGEARRSGLSGGGNDPAFAGLPSPTDAALAGLEIWTGQFIDAGVTLTRDRQRLTDMLAAPFSAIYRDLAGESERASLTYQPSFDEVLFYPDEPQRHISEHFQRIYPGEMARGQNLIGPHRDDLEIELDGMAAREFASNGEMWTMALALKLALYRVIAAERGVKPIVILDDVFAQLDESRRRQILDFAARQDQVLITVAAASDIPDFDTIGGGKAGGRSANIIDVAALKRAQDAYLHPDLSAFGIEVES